MSHALIVGAEGPLRGPLVEIFGTGTAVVELLEARGSLSAKTDVLIIDATADDFDLQGDGLTTLVDDAARAFAARGDGRIVVIGRSTSFIGMEGHRAAATGTALLGLVRSVGVEVAADGATVNLVLAGPFHEMTDREAARTALARCVEPKEVAAAVAFLCSPDAGFCTGSVVPVDGGLSIGFA